ncbi:MAG: hypothetical protein IJO45_01650 [Oscillospiraceae bacterium]|nr:hypothetical protein [Oscillospiraceae bacterium]
MERICDLHGHFLPGMDDGCKTPEEAVQVLQCSYRQGVRRVFATPHYYPVEPVEAFLQRRTEAVQRLEAYIQSQGVQDIPQILLGAEVAYRPGLGYEENIEKLCLGNSRYLLLEMPFSRWGKAEEREVRNLGVTGGVIPILAHIERYFDYQDKRTLAGILEQDVLVQMNAEALLDPAVRRQALKLVKRGIVQLLGTDCHNMTDRAPNLDKALAFLQKKKMADAISQIIYYSEEVCGEAMG